MPASSIGTYNFISMKGQPVTAGQQLEMETKPGVAGTGFWKTGVRGQEYSVETIVDIDTWPNAVALEVLYRATKNAGPLTIVFGGVSLGNVIVLDVQATAERIAFGRGGYYTNPAAIVRGTWRLIAV